MQDRSEVYSQLSPENLPCDVVLPLRNSAEKVFRAIQDVPSAEVKAKAKYRGWGIRS